MMRVIFFDFFGVLSTTMYTFIINKYLPEDERAGWLAKLDLIDSDAMPESEFVQSLANRLGKPAADLQREADATPTFNQPMLDYIIHDLKPRYAVGLITNVPRTLMERIAAKELALFDPVIISSDLKIIKPDPRIFEAALHQANCRADEAIFIDDRQKNVAAANALGMHGLLYTDFPTLKRDLETLLHH